MADIKFCYGSYTAYQNLENYDNDTLYFITGVGSNSGAVFKGAAPYGTAVKAVSTLPQTGSQGIMYVLPDSSAYYWNGSTYTTLNVGLVSTISDSNTDDSKGLTVGALKLYIAGQIADMGTDQEISNAKSEAIQSANEYTDSQIAANVASVFKYKGALDTTDDLENVESPSTGDVYHINADGKEYVYNGTDWELLGFLIDLSDYATTTAVTSAINAKAAEVIQTINAYSKTEIDEMIAPFTAHINDSTIHPTVEQQAAWSAKASTSYVDTAAANALSSANGYTDEQISTVNTELSGIQSALTWTMLEEPTQQSGE